MEGDELVIFTNKIAQTSYDQFWEINKEEMECEQFVMRNGIAFVKITHN